jgi:lysozyme
MGQLSAAGEKFIVNEEGIRLNSYLDQVGVWTIGVGHTGPELHGGITWTREKVMEVFRADVARFAAAVTKLVGAALKPHEFDALVSFAFNVGTGNFASSTLLRKLNALDYRGAGEQFSRWNKGKINGVLTELPVLTARRRRERKLFEEGQYV